MSLLIKGSPAPGNCHECDSWGLSDMVTIDCPVDKDGSLYSFTDRPKGCPLVHVPEHGRLIDADAIHYFKDDSNLLDFDYAYRSQINSMPTIIPADKEGEG